MLNSYFYKLLHRYISLYIFPCDSMVEVDPKSMLLFECFSNRKKSVAYMNGKDSTGACGSSPDIGTINPDFLVLNGILHFVDDIQGYLQRLQSMCTFSTRLIITYYSSAWSPAFRLATAIGLRSKTSEQNWITNEDMENFLYLSGYEVVKRENKILFPFYIPLLSNFMNRYLAPLPFFRLFTMVNIVVARPLRKKVSLTARPSVSVVVPARNECGNIEELIQRLPKMGSDDEVIFIEGNSTDGTWEKICDVRNKYNSRNIKSERQEGKGKGDAVRKGFSLATKDILMILDADMTVPPEDLPKFYEAIISDKGEFINGSRLVYPMEKHAMRFFNLLGNKFFATAFSFVLGQRFKDTLCGTKVLTRDRYLNLVMHRSYFGEFDPFGDFDLIFGASRMGLKIIEVPVKYRERTYGDTNISRWKHGVILLTMLAFAARKIKFI